MKFMPLEISSERGAFGGVWDRYIVGFLKKVDCDYILKAQCMNTCISFTKLENTIDIPQERPLRNVYIDADYDDDCGLYNVNDISLTQKHWYVAVPVYYHYADYIQKNKDLFDDTQAIRGVYSCTKNTIRGLWWAYYNEGKNDYSFILGDPSFDINDDEVGFIVQCPVKIPNIKSIRGAYRYNKNNILNYLSAQLSKQKWFKGNAHTRIRIDDNNNFYDGKL